MHGLASAQAAARRFAQVPSYLYFSLLTGLRKPNMKLKFTADEDTKLAKLVAEHGTKDWVKISFLMQTRNPRQCRERWNNYLNPDLRTDPWTAEEDQILEEKYKEYGAKWNKISKFLQNRSDNNIRNRWMMIARRKNRDDTFYPSSGDHSSGSEADDFDFSGVTQTIDCIDLCEPAIGFAEEWMEF